MADRDVDYDPLPSPSAYPPQSFGSAGSLYRPEGNASTAGSPTLGPAVVSKKLELWKRRLARAHEQLDGLGVALYTWRRGNDVIAEAEGIVKRTLADMEKKRRMKQ
jgi:ATP-dependent RNA helicase DDX27